MALPNSPIPVSNLTSWLNRLHSAIRGSLPGGSDTVAVSSTYNGTVFEIKDHALAPRNLVSGFEEYVDGNGYSVNELVYVKTEKTYIDETENAYYSVPGTYICVSPVPPKVELSTLPDGYLKTYYTRINQLDGVVYAPVAVENDTRELAHLTTDGKGKYWHLIAPALKVARSCKNGETLVTYAAAQQSGSAA